jgi:hypothetical protein
MTVRHYEFTVPRWHPQPLNKLLGCHWGTRAKLKRADADMIAIYAMQAGVPRATGRRRVVLRLTLGPGQQAADPDAYWKSLLDALARAGLLVDDNRQGVELGGVVFDRGVEQAMTVILENLDGPPAAQGERRDTPATPGGSRAAGVL